MAQGLVGPSKKLKQIIQIKHNIVKNPNWPEANKFAIYKCGRGSRGHGEINAASVQSWIRRADHSATLPPFKTNFLLHRLELENFLC